MADMSRFREDALPIKEEPTKPSVVEPDLAQTTGRETL
jgi:hypothetical protein